MKDDWRIFTRKIYRSQMIGSDKKWEIILHGRWIGWGQFLKIRGVIALSPSLVWRLDVIIRRPILVARPPSAKMLEEYANVLEVHHPAFAENSRGYTWMRHVSEVVKRQKSWGNTND